MGKTQTPSLIDEAAQWLAALDAGTADPEAFEAWRTADPRHAVAFAQVASVWTQLGEARHVAPDAEPALAQRTPDLPHWRRFAQAAAIALAVCVAGVASSQFWARASAETSVGERRTVQIGQGARIELNTDTAVEWREGREGSEVWIEKGQIGLDVPVGANQVIVRAGDAEATLASGRYDIRIIGATMSVLVLEGHSRAAWTSEVAAAGTKLLLEGENARIAAPAAVETDRALAWRRGEVVFAGETLARATEEYNRYLVRKLVVGDPAIAGIELGGRFTSQDPADFLSALRASFGVKAAVRGNQIVLVAGSKNNSSSQ
jgi:transmembrane sensor